MEKNAGSFYSFFIHVIVVIVLVLLFSKLIGYVKCQNNSCKNIEAAFSQELAPFSFTVK